MRAVPSFSPFARVADVTTLPSRRSLLLVSLAGSLTACTSPVGPLLPGSRGGETSTPDPADSDASSGGTSEPDEGNTETPTAPGITAEEWAKPSLLTNSPPDVAAADARFGTAQGQYERTDRYGTWYSPGFPTSSEILNPDVTVDLDGFDADRAQKMGAGVLVHAIVTIADSPLAFEADNSRYTEVSPELVESLGFDFLDAHGFDDVFEKSPLSGTGDPSRSATEFYGVEPVPYDPEGPRAHVLDYGVRIRPAQFEWTGTAIHASTRCVIPVTTDDGEELFVREGSLDVIVGAGANDGQIALATGISAGRAFWIDDIDELPLIEVAAEVPDTWQEHRIGPFTVSLPPGGDPIITDLSVTLGGGGESVGRRAVAFQSALGVPTPYPVFDGEAAARFDVPGADLTVAMIGTQDDGQSVVTIRCHSADLSHHVQLYGWDLQEAPQLVHQVIAGIRLA